MNNSGNLQVTEIGLIPSNWRVLSGEEISIKITKGASPKWQGFTYQNDGMLFVTSENVRDGFLDIDEPKFLPLDFHNKLRNSQLKKGDILINIVGASIGRACIFDIDYSEANINQAVCLFRPKSDFDPIYLLNYILLPQSLKRLLDTQSATARPNLSLANIKEFKLAIPPISEQRKIAAILSTWDEAIGLVGQLIAALGRRKQALMQLLLTGEVRFAGFDGEWADVPLGEIFTLRSGKTKPEDTDSSATLERRIPIYGGNGILGYTARILEVGERLIIGRVGEYCGVVHYINEPAWITDNALYTTHFLHETSVSYLASLLEYLDLGKLRSKGGQPLVSQQPIYNLRTQIPKYSEQKQIAEVIQIADEELGLVCDLNKHLQDQKRGLMQKLLTGQMRV